MITRLDQSSTFNCAKCGFTTCGIIRSDSAQDRRWCPACSSPLFQCNYCHHFISGTIVALDVICDGCKKVVAPEALIV